MFLPDTAGEIQQWRQRGLIFLLSPDFHIAWHEESCCATPSMWLPFRSWGPPGRMRSRHQGTWSLPPLGGLSTANAHNCFAGSKGQDLGFLWVQLKSHSWAFRFDFQQELVSFRSSVWDDHDVVHLKHQGQWRWQLGHNSSWVLGWLWAPLHVHCLPQRVVEYNKEEVGSACHPAACRWGHWMYLSHRQASWPWLVCPRITCW